MASPRQLGRGLFARLVARVLIAVLLFSLVPLQAQASIPKSTLPDPRPTEHPAPMAAKETACLVVVVVVVWDPNWLTKSAFGELLGHSGTDPQPYAFAGEPLDPNSGFQYHRARWMDPRAGRFASIDTWEGDAFDPSSLHRYLYASASPNDVTDPSGLYSQAFGYAVEDAIEPLYRADHPGDGIVFGRWNRVGLNPRLKPDILNYSRLQYLEIKPLSYSGITLATAKMGINTASFTWVGFYPDIEWEPAGGLVTVGAADVLVFNVAGVLFYTDALALAEELVTIKVLSDVYRLLRSRRLATSALFEGARIARLASVATVGGQSRINSAIGPALLVVTLGGF